MASGPEETTYSTARRIRRGERDRELALDGALWPAKTATLSGWERKDGYFRRLIAQDDKGLLGAPLEEALLRFPAAPLHSVHRLHEGHHTFGLAENFHTLRIATRVGFEGPVERIFLFHNGLNELDNANLFYQLASHLVNDPACNTACILRPFPGHLMRFPFHGFAETPLDRYLWDGSHLFRQFLRYMVETQWLLSALVRRSQYPCPAGANLLAESAQPSSSRLIADKLAESMGQAWEGLYKASDHALKQTKRDQTRAPGMKSELSQPEILSSISVLRSYLQLEKYPLLGSHHTATDQEPSIHVIGYSLGGFLAQSVFMSWPFAVDSCSTLLSGGALRELAPTAFADPEEWQTVLHSLRYELDEGMLSGRYAYREGGVAGIECDLFLYLQRTFYEVFQQEHKGSFQSRLEAFRQRMLFVVGGNDPIVRPKAVLDSEPPGGINLLEIAGLGHFIGRQPDGPEEEEQRRFWLPEIGGLVRRFAKQATDAQRAERDETWLTPQFTISPSENQTGKTVKNLQLSEAERNAFRRDGALPADLFERYLDDLLARRGNGRPGYLWILRNEIPTFLLDADSIQQRGRALHHDDAGIVEYCRGVSRRREALDEHDGHFSVVLPWNVRRILSKIDPEHGVPSQAETAIGQMPAGRPLETVWSDFLITSNELVKDGDAPYAVLVYDGRRLLDHSVTARRNRKSEEAAEIRASIVRAGLSVVRDTTGSVRADDRLRIPSLPDCWIWASKQFLGVDQIESGEEACLALLSAATRAQPKNSNLGEAVSHGEIRILTVSRARFNPRFRGRLVTDTDSTRSLLLHASLCISSAMPFHRVDWDTVEQDPEETTAAGGAIGAAGPSR